MRRVKKGESKGWRAKRENGRHGPT